MTLYKNPPIIESVCEFRFPAKTSWDANIASKYYDRIKDTFPLREKREQIEINNNLNISNGTTESKITKQQINIFFTNDKNYLIQLAERRLSIHCLKPYSSWEGFLPKIHFACDALSELITLDKIERIGLLYLNKIDLPINDWGKINEYLNFYHTFPTETNGVLSSYLVADEFVYQDGRDVCRITLKNGKGETENALSIMLTTDYFLLKKNEIDMSNYDNWLSEAHQNSYNLFSSCITSKLEESFGISEGTR